MKGLCMLAVLGCVALLAPTSLGAVDNGGCDGSLVAPFDREDERVVVCYAGNFLVKMLGELDAGQAKTFEHVRAHLLPYLGGTPTLRAAGMDDPDDASCRVCFANNQTSSGLMALRDTLDNRVLYQYDNLGVCYASLTRRIMDHFNRSADSVFLLPSSVHTNPVAEVQHIFFSLFSSPDYDVASCRTSAASPRPSLLSRPSSPSAPPPSQPSHALAPICDEEVTGMEGDQLAVTCYAGTFLTKMLSELNAGNNKTVQHVWVHLLPYLGGKSTLDALQTDSPEDPTCTACYSDPVTSAGLSGLRDTVPVFAQQLYDSMGVCYPFLTERVLESIPTSPDGVWLVPQEKYKNNSTGQVVLMFRELFSEPEYNAASCRTRRSASTSRQVDRRGARSFPASLDYNCTSDELTVVFAGITHYRGDVQCGNLFLQTDLQDVPLVTYPNAKPDRLYTLLMVDPDANLKGSWPEAEGTGTLAPVRHWVVGNIQGSDLVFGAVEGGTVVTPYAGPSPPGGSHRYGLFVFEQLGKIPFTPLDNTKRVNWDVVAFVAKYALGDKVASNYFICQTFP